MPLIYYSKTHSKVQLLHMIKNKEFSWFNLQLYPSQNTYRSIRTLLNSTLTRNEFGSSQPKPYTKQRVPNHVSKRSRPKLDFHTPVIYIHILIVPYNPRHVSILKFHTYDLLFPFLLSSFLFSSSSSSFLFSSLSLSKTKMRYLFWSYPFLFHFPVKGGNFLPLSFKPLVSSTIFILISF